MDKNQDFQVPYKGFWFSIQQVWSRVQEFAFLLSSSNNSYVGKPQTTHWETLLQPLVIFSPLKGRKVTFFNKEFLQLPVPYIIRTDLIALQTYHTRLTKILPQSSLLEQRFCVTAAFRKRDQNRDILKKKKTNIEESKQKTQWPNLLCSHFICIT